MNFKDPVTLFAYNLISLHHDIMWYIIIILTLVYWSLYKILKEYSWNTFNKQEGFLLSFLNNPTILKVQKFIFYLWVTFIKIFIKIKNWMKSIYKIKMNQNKLLLKLKHLYCTQHKTFILVFVFVSIIIVCWYPWIIPNLVVFAEELKEFKEEEKEKVTEKVVIINREKLFDFIICIVSLIIFGVNVYKYIKYLNNRNNNDSDDSWESWGDLEASSNDTDNESNEIDRILKGYDEE
jgi:hypothetical protein